MHAVLHRGKQLLVVGGMASALVLGARTEATLAQADQAAASVSHECVGEFQGQGTVTVHGEVKSTQSVPNERSQGRGPCSVPPGQDK
jgi:hypothetical protein